MSRFLLIPGVANSLLQAFPQKLVCKDEQISISFNWKIRGRVGERRWRGREEREREGREGEGKRTKK